MDKQTYSCMITVSLKSQGSETSAPGPVPETLSHKLRKCILSPNVTTTLEHTNNTNTAWVKLMSLKCMHF